MAKKAGSAISAACVKASTWGTAVAASTGDKLQDVNISYALNETILKRRGVGSGKAFQYGATRGAELPSVTITGDLGVQNRFDFMLAQLMGTASVGSEITASQGDYKHTITWNSTPNSKLATIAWENSTGTTVELPSVAFTQMIIRSTSIPGYLEYQAQGIANKIEYSSAVNTNAVLQAATLADSELLLANFDDDFWINTQAGSTLSSSNILAGTKFELTINRPQACPQEFKGSAGLGSPDQQEEGNAMLKLDLSGLDDHTYIAYHIAETGLKGKFIFEGNAIGSGSNKTLMIYIPRMQLLAHPQNDVAGKGVNPAVYTFECAVADSNPSGMSSTMPYFEIINTKSTAILA